MADIDVYDIAQAVSDGATVPIYYEGRVAKIEMSDDAGEILDAEFKDIIEGAEAEGVEYDEDAKGAMTSKWTQLEKLVGSEPRLDAVVTDLAPLLCS